MKVAASKAGYSVDEYRSRVVSGFKWCYRCRQWKPLTDYSRDVTRHDGRCARCITCRRVKVRVCTKGRTSTFKGRTHTTEAKAAISKSKKGLVGTLSPRFGKKHSEETKAKISAIVRVRQPRGKDCYNFSHGKFQRALDDRRKPEYKQWRDAVYTRDSYTCQHCSDATGGNLQAHHIKSFADHPELRFDVANGMTLCQDCHERLHLKPIPMPADLRRRRKHKI